MLTILKNEKIQKKNDIVKRQRFKNLQQSRYSKVLHRTSQFFF